MSGIPKPDVAKSAYEPHTKPLNREPCALCDRVKKRRVSSKGPGNVVLWFKVVYGYCKGDYRAQWVL